MSSALFLTHEHVIQGQHIREYPAATVDSQEEALNLHIKHYVPLNNPNPTHGDVTVVAAHAIGFPKVGPAAEPKSSAWRLTCAGVI